MAKTQTLSQVQVQLPAVLPITAEELENFLRDVEGAEIVHPVRIDPVAIKNGEIIAFWTE